MKDFEGNRQFLGDNPARGARISYFLKSAAKDLKLTVKDASGAVLRELSGDDTKDARKAGINMLVWDGRVKPIAPMRNQQGGGGGGGFFGNINNGPLVLPGTYRVALTVDGREAQAVNVRVQGDPEIQITDADRKTHFDAVLALHTLQGTMNEAADLVIDMNKQLTSINDALTTERAGEPEDDGGRPHEAGERSADAPRRERRGRVRRRRRSQPERAGPRRPAEGADHGLDFAAYRDTDAQGRRGPHRGVEDDRRRECGSREVPGALQGAGDERPVPDAAQADRQDQHEHQPVATAT
jgi:hypothetical protein